MTNPSQAVQADEANPPSNVVDLAEWKVANSPHCRGRARCLDCKHEWECVAPIGVYWFECPACSLMRGKYIFAFNFEKQLHWFCACGNDLFYMLADACYCPNCGEKQKGF